MSTQDIINTMSPEERALEIQRRMGTLKDRPPIDTMGGAPYIRDPASFEQPPTDLDLNTADVQAIIQGVGQQSYSAPDAQPSVYSPMVAPQPQFTKDQQLRIMIEEAKLAKNTGETMFNTTLERKRRAADLSVIDPIAEDYWERIRQQEEIAKRINSIITPQLAQEQEKVQAAQEQQKQLMGQMLGMAVPQQKRGKLELADIISAGIASLFGGAQGMNQALEGGYQRAGQDAQMQYQNEAQQFEQNRQNIMLQLQQLGMDEKTAQRAFEVLQNRQFDLQDQATRQTAAESADQRDYEREKMRQDALTSRTEMTVEQRAVSNRNKVLATVLPYATTLDERNKLIDWAANMRQEELDVVAGLSDAEILKRAQTANVNARTETENVMRPWKVGKAKADIQRVIGGIKLDDARKRQIEQKISHYDDEFQLRAANVYSQMAARDLKGKGATDYWGKGYESSFNQMANIAKQQITLITSRNAGSIAMGGKLPPDEQAAYDQAQNDLKVAEDSLKRIADGKAERARNYGRGGGNGPAKQIDVSGGFTDSDVEPYKPEVPGVTDNRFAGAKATAGGQKQQPANNGKAAQLRREAKAAIDAGADPAKVNARLKSELAKLKGK